MDEKVPMTRKGYEKMQDELKQLKFVDRHEVIEAIEEARSGKPMDKLDVDNLERFVAEL